MIQRLRVRLVDEGLNVLGLAEVDALATEDGIYPLRSAEGVIVAAGIGVAVVTTLSPLVKIRTLLLEKQPLDPFSVGATLTLKFPGPILTFNPGDGTSIVDPLTDGFD